MLPLVRVPCGMWLRGKESCLHSVPRPVGTPWGGKEGGVGWGKGGGEAVDRTLPTFPIQGLDGVGSCLSPSLQDLVGWTGPWEA